MKSKLISSVSLFLVFSLSAIEVLAECNCGSTDTSSPCAGTIISVAVNNTGANGADIPAFFTWNFNSGGVNAQCGQFANGDYWIAPGVGQTEVTITSVTGSDAVTVDADPLTGKFGLLDGTNVYSGYNATEKLTFPFTYSSITSLVAAIQRDEADPLVGNCGTAAIVGECVDAYNVVTVLTTVPKNNGADMIRPNITGKSKEFLTISNFDLSRIPSKSFLTGTNEAGFEAIRQRWSHSTEIFGLGFSVDGGATIKSNSEAGRAFRSHILIDDYGAGAARSFHNDLATLFSSENTQTEKTTAIAALLAYGLDLYHARYDPPSPYTAKWGSGAGQHLGKFTPVVFLAALEKNNANRLGNIQAEAGVSNLLQPQELAQLHVGPNGPVWGDDEGIIRYWNDLIWAKCYDGAVGTCDTTVGKRTAADPHKFIDGPANKPGSNYFPIGYAGILNFSGVMLMMPEFYEAVNTTITIDFVKRARTHGLQTLPDPCVNRDARESVSCNIWEGGIGCDYYYPSALINPTWGPRSSTDKDAGCGDVEIPQYTKAGRFASMDGTPAPILNSYTAGQLFNNWDTILSSSTGGGGNPVQTPVSFRLQ